VTRTDKPKEAATLGPYPVKRATMDLLAALQQAVRDADRSPPSKGLLLSALLYAAPRDGEELEEAILKPYRRDHPDEDVPR
jgi:hypothetical protein